MIERREGGDPARRCAEKTRTPLWMWGTYTTKRKLDAEVDSRLQGRDDFGGEPRETTAVRQRRPKSAQNRSPDPSRGPNAPVFRAASSRGDEEGPRRPESLEPRSSRFELRTSTQTLQSWIKNTSPFAEGQGLHGDAKHEEHPKVGGQKAKNIRVPLRS